MLNDTEDEAERGQLIGFVHAMRLCEPLKMQGMKVHKITKPYKK